MLATRIVLLILSSGRPAPVLARRWNIANGWIGHSDSADAPRDLEALNARSARFAKLRSGSARTSPTPPRRAAAARGGWRTAPVSLCLPKAKSDWLGIPKLTPDVRWCETES